MYSNTCRYCNVYPKSICCYCLLKSANLSHYYYSNYNMRYEPCLSKDTIPSTVSKKRFRSATKKFTTEEALEISKELNIDFSQFDVNQFRMGLDVELEHGIHDPHTNVTNDDPLITGKIALAHLNEFPDYYTRLNRMEEEAETYWGKEEFH